MSRIYDNIETKFLDGLVKLMEESNVKRADFCVGYFNLRGWKLIVNQIDNLEGDFVYEDATNSQQHRCCRLLIGMHRPDEQLVRDFIRNSDTMDAASSTKFPLAKTVLCFCVFALNCARAKSALNFIFANLFTLNCILFTVNRIATQ